MTSSNTDISNAEWQLMRIIWTHPGLTSRQLIDDTQSILPWKEGTIKSLLHRLLQKNLLRQDKADCQDLMQQLHEKLKSAPQNIECQCPPHQCTCQSHCP